MQELGIPSDFDPSQVERPSFEPFTAQGAMATVERVHVYNSGPRGIIIAFKILEGQAHAGRWASAHYNTVKKNGDVNHGGCADYADACRALGLDFKQVKNSDQLIGRAAKIDVKIGKDKNGQPESQVSKVRASSGAPAPAAAPAVVQSDDSPPWAT